MSEHNYRFYLSMILGLMLCAFCSGAQEKYPSPHVVIILADDMGYGDPQLEKNIEKGASESMI